MADEAKYLQILDAVKVGILGLSLPGLSSAGVIVVKTSKDREDKLPCMPGVLVTPWGSRAPSPTQGTNIRDDIPYRVLVACLSPSNQDQAVNFNRQLLWTERIQSKFRHQRLEGVTSVFTTVVENEINFEPGMFLKGFDASVVVFRFMSREGRG